MEDMQRLSRSSTGLVMASFPSIPEQIPGPVQSHPPGQLQALQLPPDPLPSSSLQVPKHLALSAQPQAISQLHPAEDTAPAFSQPPPA